MTGTVIKDVQTYQVTGSRKVTLKTSYNRGDSSEESDQMDFITRKKRGWERGLDEKESICLE